MLTFIVRRILYSIPVVLIASALVFVFVRETTNPLARLSQVRDPSAKTDLPALARLMGHEVKGFEEHPGGALVFTVVRGR